MQTNLFKINATGFLQSSYTRECNYNSERIASVECPKYVIDFLQKTYDIIFSDSKTVEIRYSQNNVFIILLNGTKMQLNQNIIDSFIENKFELSIVLYVDNQVLVADEMSVIGCSS